MAEVLRAQDLSVRYNLRDGEIQAVNGVSFALEEESILCLVGESGAGKSTTGLALMGLLPRAGRVVSGSVYFGGIDILSTDRNILQQIRGKEIAMVPQEPKTAFNPVLTIGAQVEEQIRAHTDMTRKQARNLALDMMKEIGLADPKDVLKRYPFELSGGMCQRVMISMALTLRPKVLIADEPTSSLDVTLQADMLRQLKSFCKEFHASMILITHDIGIVAQMADEVAVMYAGTIVEFSEVHSLFDHPQHPYMWGLFQSLPDPDNPYRRFQPISGNPPDMMNLPGQCAFLPRCPKGTIQCRLKPRPPLEEVEPDHMVACYNPVDYRRIIDGRES